MEAFGVVGNAIGGLVGLVITFGSFASIVCIAVFLYGIRAELEAMRRIHAASVRANDAKIDQ